jgi:hypothetical protein
MSRLLSCIICLLGMPLLFACTGEAPPDRGGVSRTGASGNNPTAPCFNNSCGAVEQLFTMPDAENLVFSPNGRLFVSGGQSVVEVVRNANGFAPATVSESQCNFTGLTVARNTLYANCGDGSLWAGSLATIPTKIKRIFSYDGTSLINGLTSSSDGLTLYAVDGPLPSNGPPTPKIVKLAIAQTDPLKVNTQTTWLDLAGRFPNGIQRLGNVLYFTDSEIPNVGRLNSVQIRPDGSASVPAVLATLENLADDFSILSDGFAISYFFTGQVVKYNFLGQKVDGFNPGTFSTGTSQVRQGQAPLFTSRDLLVTEKGILGEQSSPIGNRLTVVRRTQ